MPLLTTNDELLVLLRKSMLIDEEKLTAFLQAHAGNLPEKPRPLAELLIRNGFLTVFQASQLLSGKWRGFLIANGKYKLLEILGVGGMGKVYLCEHRRMKRLVAVKVLPTDRLKEPTSLERFEREARAAGTLDHPNIVRAYDLDQDGDLHFLVMEYIDGSTLNEVVRKSGPLAIARACHYISQAAEGLQHAHEAAGLVHRDVKPGNLILDRAGTLRLLDLGLARFFYDDGSQALTKRYEKTAILGTADYLAPEQVDDSSTVDIRADIYSLGVTFYFLLCGQSPFDHGSTKEKLLWHLHKEPESIRTMRRDVPLELESVITKMMAKKPAERYRRPIDVVEALQPWTQEPIDPPTAEEMPRLCPALESVVLAGMGGPLSGAPGSSSNVRLRSRNGSRSGVRNRGVTPPPGAPTVRMSNIWAGTAAFLLGLGALIWWTHQPIDSKATPPLNIPSMAGNNAGLIGELPGPEVLPSPENATLFVTRDPRRRAAAGGRRDIVESLGEALARAEPESRVVVLDGPVEGQLRVDGARIHGLTIEGRGDRGTRILWKPPEGGPADQPLLFLNSAEATRVTGFEFDGVRRLDTLVRIDGAATGVKLDNCTATDALRSAIVLSDVAAPEDRPLVLDHVRCLSQRDYLVAAPERPDAIVCTARSTAAPPAIVIRHCRIEGRYRAGIGLESPTHAQIQLNRFYRPAQADATSAVEVQIPDSGAVRLTMGSNTALGFVTLMRLDHVPATSRGCTFLLRSNLMLDGEAFVMTDPGTNLDAAKTLFAGSLGNVARPDDCNHGLPVLEKVSVVFGDIDFDPASAHFLRYAKSGDTLTLYTAGAGGEPVGVPPVE